MVSPNPLQMVRCGLHVLSCMANEVCIVRIEYLSRIKSKTLPVILKRMYKPTSHSWKPYMRTTVNKIENCQCLLWICKDINNHHWFFTWRILCWSDDLAFLKDRLKNALCFSEELKRSCIFFSLIKKICSCLLTLLFHKWMRETGPKLSWFVSFEWRLCRWALPFSLKNGSSKNLREVTERWWS